MSRQVLAIATIAAVTGLTGTLAISLNAQQAPRPRPRAAAVEPLPAPGGELKTVLYNWANHMGMLRGVQENDAIGTLDYVGTGTINVGGQACRLTKYHAEINYQMSGMREDFACTLPNGQKREEIRVIGGQYAWNEIGGPGAGLVPGKGTATSTPEAYNERAIRLWSGPQGAVKAARLNGGAETKVSVEGEKTVLTYPIPGVTGAMAKATLTSGPVKGVCTRNCAERIEVRQGDTVTEFTYSNYKDYNDPEEQLDAFFAGHIVEKRGPLTVLDLTVTRTNTPNLYVVVPVPPVVKAAGPAVPTK